jgi:hypothetical protein
MTPADVTPNHVALFLRSAPRPACSAREPRQGCFSAFMSWLIVTGEVPELLVNPCLRGSGVKRNAERSASGTSRTTSTATCGTWPRAPSAC